MKTKKVEIEIRDNSELETEILLDRISSIYMEFISMNSSLKNWNDVPKNNMPQRFASLFLEIDDILKILEKRESKDKMAN